MCGSATVFSRNRTVPNIYPAATVTSNHISNSSCYAINLLTGAATITDNVITSNGFTNCVSLFGAPVGINFACHTNTVSGNIINGVTSGIEYVPAAFKGENTFYNVPTINYGGGGC